ncbi:MAG: peptide chain release factor N(5)-glutamine methyltransferase [Isosphaeraceae bacterium]
MPSDEGRIEEPWTIRRLLTWTRDFLQRRGSESPRLDAEVMLAHVLDWERVELYTHHDEEIGEQARSAFRELVRRRAEGAPVAYLVGRKEFYSLALDVSPAVLIPRPETEFLVVEFLEWCKRLERPRAVDVGTGSGCVAIACTHQHPTAEFIAIDASADALTIAQSNARKHGVGSRIDFRQGDALLPVASEAPFDAILSNPPYIPTGDVATLEHGVRDHEPHLALDGGPDGLRVVSRIIDQAVPLLRPGGHLILEIGTTQEQSVRALIEAHPEYQLAPTVFDLRKHPRVIRASVRGQA